MTPSSPVADGTLVRHLTEIAEPLAGRGVDLGGGGLCSWFGSVGDGRSRLLVGAEIGVFSRWRFGLARGQTASGYRLVEDRGSLMGETAGDYLCERLLDWGVSTIYGFPGDGILGALRRYADRLRFIQTRHEEMAAFMACGHALFAELSRQLPDNAILSSDSGSAANWFAWQVKIRRGMKASLSGNLATMVPGVPYAIAPKFGFPDRVSVAMVGDGAMQMGGMAELLTAAKYYQTWADPRLVVLILNNEDLNQVTWEQRAMAGDPKFHASQDIPYVPYHAYAEMIGLRGIKVERSVQIEGARREALSSDRPVIIDAMTDPEEPPIPPHVSFAQMEAMTKAFVAAPKEGLPGALSAVREFAHEFLPGR